MPSEGRPFGGGGPRHRGGAERSGSLGCVSPGCSHGWVATMAGANACRRIAGWVLALRPRRFRHGTVRWKAPLPSANLMVSLLAFGKLPSLCAFNKKGRCIVMTNQDQTRDDGGTDGDRGQVKSSGTSK